MLDNFHIASAQRNWSLAGLGSACGLLPHPDTFHRGYGWGRMIDSDFFPEPVVLDFHSNAAQVMGSAKEHHKTHFPLS